MKPPIPWLRVIVEGVVIVGSILLAFGIDAWWEGRQERAEEQEILRGLEMGFVYNLGQLRAVIGLHERFEGHLVQLAEMTDVQLSGVPGDSLSLYARALDGVATFDARDGTLDGVMASGKLALIRDSRLRDLLVDWKGQVEDAEEEAEAVRAVAARARERGAELGGPWSGSRVLGSIAEVPSLAEAWQRLPRMDLKVVANDDALMAIARQKRREAILYSVRLVQLEEHGGSVLEQIQASIR